MTTSDVYQKILSQLDNGEMDELQRTIFAALRKAYPHGRTRRQLIQDCYGHLPVDTYNLNNDPYDRKIRIAISRMLTDLHIPIFSTSGEPGYRIDISEANLKAMISEFQSRRARADERIRAAEQLLVKVRQYGMEVIPTRLADPDRAEQLSFLKGHER